MVDMSKVIGVSDEAAQNGAAGPPGRFFQLQAEFKEPEVRLLKHRNLVAALNA